MGQCADYTDLNHHLQVKCSYKPLPYGSYRSATSCALSVAAGTSLFFVATAIRDGGSMGFLAIFDAYAVGVGLILGCSAYVVDRLISGLNVFFIKAGWAPGKWIVVFGFLALLVLGIY